jgi:uncharacterized protein YndB with AHSA1/START domain
MENDFEPILNREFTFRMAPQKGWDGITHCKVTELEPMKKIAYTYSGSASGEKALACAGIHSETADKATKNLFTKLDTRLAIELEPTCGGTILKLTHSGFKGFVQVIISFIFGKGWKKQVKIRLPKVLQEMQGTPAVELPG